MRTYFKMAEHARPPKSIQFSLTYPVATVTRVYHISDNVAITDNNICFQVYRWVSANALEFRLTVNGYVHPSYDSAKRMGDLSLIKVSVTMLAVCS